MKSTICTFDLGPLHIGSQVPTWRHSPNFWAAIDTIGIWLFVVKVGFSLFYAENVHGACVESWVQLFARPNFQHKSRASPSTTLNLNLGFGFLMLAMCVWFTPLMKSIVCTSDLGPLHIGSQVPSPNLEAKSQFLSFKTPLKYDYLSLKLVIILWKDIRGACVLGPAVCSTQLSTQVPSLTSKNGCHVGICVILET